MRGSGFLLGLYVWLMLGFIFAPILASFVFSFNSDRFPSLPLGAFSLAWYRAILDEPSVWQGLRNSVGNIVQTGDLDVFRARSMRDESGLVGGLLRTIAVRRDDLRFTGDLVCR